MLGRKEHHKFLEFTKTIIERSIDKKRGHSRIVEGKAVLDTDKQILTLLFA